MRDDKAQMMLLTAVILVIGFIALAGMAARLSQIPQDIQQGRDVSFFQEAERVADGVEGVVLVVLETVDPCDDDFEGTLQGALQHLALIEAGRGYTFTLREADPGVALFELEGVCPDSVTKVSVAFLLRSDWAAIQMAVSVNIVA